MPGSHEPQLCISHLAPAPCPLPAALFPARSISVDDMRVEEMTAAHYLAFKEKLVPMEAGEAPEGAAGGRFAAQLAALQFSGWKPLPAACRGRRFSGPRAWPPSPLLQARCSVRACFASDLEWSDKPPVRQ